MALDLCQSEDPKKTTTAERGPVSENDRQMISKYKVFSRSYDNVFYLLERLVFWKDEMDPRAVLVRKIPDDDLSILDVCCGTGRDSLALAKSNNTITGIDLSPHMLARARKKARMKGLTNTSFHQMNATEVGFQDQEFDVIVSSFALHEMDYEPMITALKEMHRVLKKGGRIYLVDYGREDHPVLQWVFSAYLKISYPQRVHEFLDYDWNKILGDIGFRLDAIEKCRVSRLICAMK